MELVLIRHARPERIENVGGPADPCLTDLGHRQAEAMAEWVAEERYDALYVSPLLRARQTVTPVERVLGMEAEVVEGVKEFDAGQGHYIPLEDMKADRAEWRRYLADQRQRDMLEFFDVVAATLEDLIARHSGQSIAVVCHGGVINAWAAQVLRLPEAQMFFEPHYTSINRFVAASSGERSVVSLNETAHLRSLD